MDFWQIFTLITGVIYMILEIRQKNFMWIVGIATSSAAMWVFFRQGLYASFGLNTYYFIMAFVGLWHWKRDKVLMEQQSMEEADICLNRLSLRTVLVSAMLFPIGVLALSWGMTWLNDIGLLNENPMSLLDSSVAVLSLIATWWLIRSYIQHWSLWIVADTLSVVLCAMQGMWWMALLYVAYVAAAIYGLFYWKKRGAYLAD
jgi:nicotinamide mononucleotide transporter